MSEHLRAFVVITALIALAFLISRKLFSHAVEPKFVERLFGAGYASTAVMFLSHNMWLFLAGVALVCVWGVRRFSHPLALFVFLLFLMPGYSIRVPGFGLINWLIELNAWRVLSLMIFLPVVAQFLKNNNLPKPGVLLADKLVLAYAVYTSAMVFVHSGNFTSGMRHFAGVGIDTLLVYYVSSRGLLLKGAERHVMSALVMAAIFLALAGSFEFGKQWLLYSSVGDALQSLPSGFQYLGRGESLRALASSGQPIVFGYLMMVAVLATSYVKGLVRSRSQRGLLFILMGLGFVSSLSRGPWVGALIGLFVIAALSSNPMRNMARLTTVGVTSALFVLLLPGGEKVIDHLPWIGSIDEGNITYREVLWKQSLLVIDKQFWTGSIGYAELQEFDALRQGGNFVDIVNSYLGILLTFGFIGLSLSLLLLLGVVFQQLKSILVYRIDKSEFQTYSLMLGGVLVSLVVTRWTVSSVFQIGILTTFLLGAGVACSILRRRNNNSEKIT